MKRGRKGLVAWAVMLLMLFVNGLIRAQNAPLPDTLNDKDGYVVPFEYDPPAQPCIVVKVTLNGGEPLRFAVNTGTLVGMFLDSSQLASLGLKAKKNAMLPNAERVPIQEVAVKDVKLLGEQGKQGAGLGIETAYAIDMSSFNHWLGDNKIAGILGLPLFEASTVRFDFDRKQLVLFPKPNAPLKLRKATTLPLHDEEPGLCFVDMANSGQNYRLKLDIGAPRTRLPFAIVSHLSPSATMSEGYEEDGAMEVTIAMRIPHFKVGSFDEPNVEVETSPAAELAALGSDILSRYVLTLDYRNLQLHLQRSSDYVKNSRLSGNTGITLTEQGKQVIVRQVNAPSSAEKAGIRVGDVVRTIDGYEVNSIGLNAGQALLNGYSGNQAFLTVVRDGQERTFKIGRRDRFDNPDRPDYGMLLFRATGKPFVVRALLEGSQAQKAGLQINDEVVTLNGRDAMTLSTGEVVAIIDGPEVKMDVKRKGEAKPLMVTLKRGVQPK